MKKKLNKKYRTILIIYDEKTKLFIQMQIEILFFSYFISNRI